MIARGVFREEEEGGGGGGGAFIGYKSHIKPMWDSYFSKKQQISIFELNVCIVERKNRVFLDMARSMLKSKKMHNIFWLKQLIVQFIC